MYLYQKDKESILLETKGIVYNSKANGRNTTRNRKKTEGIPYRIITSHPLHADSIQNTSAAAELVAHPPVTVRDAPPPVMELHRFRDIGKKHPLLGVAGKRMRLVPHIVRFFRHLIRHLSSGFQGFLLRRIQHLFRFSAYFVQSAVYPFFQPSGFCRGRKTISYCSEDCAYSQANPEMRTSFHNQVSVFRVKYSSYGCSRMPRTVPCAGTRYRKLLAGKTT